MSALLKNTLLSRWLVFTFALLFLSACVQNEEEKKPGAGTDCQESGIFASLTGNGKNCDKGNSGDSKDKDKDKEPAPQPNPPVTSMPQLPGRECTVDRFQQNSQEEVVKKVDILFVMDHSGSMADDWGRVAANIGHMVREMPNDLDIRYAVLLANASAWKGRLYAPAKIPVVLSNQSMKIQEVSNNLHKIFTEGMKVPDSIGQGEAAFLSLYHAVTTNARDNQKAGFFRPDAALSVLFMSDEHEIGSPFPNPQAPGLPPRCDAAFEDKVKREQYDAKGINLDVTFNAMKALKGDMPVITNAFVNITKEDLFKRNSKNASCLYDSLGYGYFEMVAKTKGVLFSIQEDKAKGLARCGQVVREQLQLIHEFPLSKPSDQVDASTILAHVDGIKSIHEYRRAANSVYLENAGAHGSTVEIRHCKPITRQEWTIQGFGGQAGQYAAGLNWKTPEYATRGKIRWGTSATNLNQETAATASGTDHVITVEGLTPNTLYYFQAVNWDEYAIELRSDVISLRTQPDWNIGAVSGQPSRNTATIKWATTQYATKGKVLYGTSADALVSESAESGPVKDHTVMISGLDSNTIYHYQILSRDEYGLEKRSAVQSLRTLIDWGIVGFSGQASRHEASLQWQTPEAETEGALVWGTAPGALHFTAASASVGTAHAVQLAGLAADTTYYFQAVSRDAAGLEKRSEVLALRTVADWQISEFSGSATKNSISVSWKTPGYNTSGRVKWGTTAESLSEQVNSSSSAQSHGAVITGLAPDTLYYLQAISTDNLGVTRASEVVAIRTEAEPVVEPELPEWEMTDFYGHADKTFATIGWKTAAYATVGKVIWGTSENNLNRQVSGIAAVKDHSLLIEGLTPDTLYYFQAVSVDDHGQEKRTPVTAVRTMAEDPTEPPPVSDWVIKSFDAATSTHSADVIWQTPGAATKATIKVGLSADNLSHMAVNVEQYQQTHLVPVSGLSPNTAYYFQVIAVDSSGRTVESVIIMKRTKAQ